MIARAREVYLAPNGEDAKEIVLHAGVECATFKAGNRKLDMIRIELDITGAHTVEETLYLNSIPKTCHMLEGLLTTSGRCDSQEELRPETSR